MCRQTYTRSFSLSTPAEDLCIITVVPSQVQQRLGCTALVIAPHERTPRNNGRFSYNQDLQLQHRPDLGSNAWSLQGATPADCILCAADQKAGLLQHLELQPVLSIVGISRGPALSNATDLHPAVAAARQSAVLGIPTVAACLASTSSQAPLEPAAEALGLLLEQLARVLQASRGWPRATNFPRAHFPFPTRGRWALGREVALPAGISTGGASMEELAAADCWALGEESSWMGELAGTLMHALLMLRCCCVLCTVTGMDSVDPV